MKNNILIFSLFLVLNGCDFIDDRFKIINKSEQGIYYSYSCDSFLIYPPTKNGIFKTNKDEKSFVYGDYVLPDSSRNIIKIGAINAWKGYLNRCNNEIYVFIFKKNVIESFDWDTIRKNKMYSKRYVFTYSELEKNNWTITYP